MPLPFDPDLLAEIQRIKAIDHHAHALPARSLAPSEAERPEPLGKPPFPYPVRLRVTNPEYFDAWRTLYGYRHEDMADEHARWRSSLASSLSPGPQNRQDARFAVRAA